MLGVSSSFPGYAGENTRILKLANNLVKRGVEVHTIVPRNMRLKAVANVEADIASSIHEVNFAPLSNYYFTSQSSQLMGFRRLHRKERFDLVHCNMFWGATLGFVVKKMFRIPVIFDPHDWFFGDLYGFPVVGDIMERLSARASDITVVTGYKLKRFLELRGICPRKISVVSNGVDMEFTRVKAEREDLDNKREVLGIEKGDHVICFIGALLPYQGIDIAIRALCEIRSELSTKLLIVGGGPENERLLSLTRLLGLNDSVHFLGKIPEKDLINVLEISDVAIVPFRNNNYTSWIQPIKVFEYFARSRPVVASNLPGISEIVENGKNGLLVTPENKEALAFTLLRLLRDRDLRLGMGKAGMNMVRERYTWEKSGRDLKRVYELALENEWA